MSIDYCGVVKACETTIRKTQAVVKKRANSILFAPMSVAHVDEEDEGQRDSRVGDVYQVEKGLPNGDYYMGHWCDSFPQGHGKYLWTDGCMYEGEWFRGKTMGRGVFSWPSGATYEGEFKSGYMDGKGTYIDSNGDTYRGNWVMNFKHGWGRKSYSNGDQYEGEWRRGIPEGRGKYVWTNGNHYVGEWKDGVICGQGALVWDNGNRYEGFWDDGLPKGTGTFRWVNGSFYMGVWSKDPAERNGTYYHSGVPQQGNIWNPQDLYNFDLMECKVCLNDKVSLLPSQKKLAMWRSSKDVEPNIKPKRMSVDSRLNLRADRDCWGDDSRLNLSPVIRVELDDSLEGSNTDDMDSSEGSTRNMARMAAPKRQGRIICKGHKNYDLMLNLQLGIRHSVGRHGPVSSLDLKASAFDRKTKIWTRFPPGGSKHTPPHQSCDFKWKDYCPMVFRTLRKLFNVDSGDYMISICGNDALREFSSPGKSGSFFYLTNDDRYMIKTMKKAEAKVLTRMLAAYYNHVRSFENTLVTKFFGLHCLKLPGTAQKKVRFIIMGNLFCTDYPIHRRFDLKGSSLGRTTDKPLSEIDETTILKDLDLNFIFRLQKSWFQEFCRQIDRDSEFLEHERIMDYSLLVGLHFRDPSVLIDFASSGSRTPSGHSENDNTIRLSNVDMEQLLIDSNKWESVRLGINMAARAERMGTKKVGGSPEQSGSGELYEVVMFFGIIDILQDYDISKKLEHAYKSFQYDPTSISAVDPKQYSKRFRDFVFGIFSEDTCFHT